MGLLDRILKRGKSRSGTNVITHSDFGFYIDGDGYVPLARNPDVIAAVNKIADMVSNMTIHLMENTDKGDIRVKDVQGWHIKLRERKTGKQITRRMTKELKKEMRRYVEGKPFHHFLFKSRQGQNKAITRERAYQIIHEAAEELGIDNVGTHTMRKTFGYKYYNKTKDVGTLQKMFNHSSPAITLRYIGIEQAELDDALRNFVI